MPPFSMLRTKKSRKLRPRTPPSPGSFYAPARSPAPWAAAPLLNRVRSNSEASGSGASLDPQGSRQQGSVGRRAPPSAWGFTDVEKSLPKPPQRTGSKDSHAPALQLELGTPQDAASWFHSEPEASVRVHVRPLSVLVIAYRPVPVEETFGDLIASQAAGARAQTKPPRIPTQSPRVPRVPVQPIRIPFSREQARGSFRSKPHSSTWRAVGFRPQGERPFFHFKSPPF